MKALLSLAAASQRQTFTNFVEVLAEDFCQKMGIVPQAYPSSKGAGTQPKRSC